MKKLFCAIVILALTLSFGITAQAGDVPEGMFSDGALLFFGEVTSYDAESGGITVLPTQKIKGDVVTDVEQTYKRGVFTWNEAFASEGDTSDFPVEGEIYLMANFDANNPLYVLRITGTDTKTLEIKGIDTSNMFGRIQTYLNDGTYEQKEAERLERIEAQTAKPTPDSAQDETAPAQPALATQPPASEDAPNATKYWVYGLSATAIGICVIAFFVKKRKAGK